MTAWFSLSVGVGMIEFLPLLTPAIVCAPSFCGRWFQWYHVPGGLCTGPAVANQFLGAWAPGWGYQCHRLPHSAAHGGQAHVVSLHSHCHQAGGWYGIWEHRVGERDVVMEGVMLWWMCGRCGLGYCTRPSRWESLRLEIVGG